MSDILKLAKQADLEFTTTFDLSAAKLIEMIGAMDAIPAKAGETLKQQKITGTLVTSGYTEGDEIPETKYTTADVQTYEITLRPYRVSTTLQQVQKRGYKRAVQDKDSKLVADIQSGLKADIVTALGKGTATASGTDFVSCAANAWAVLENAVEDKGFGDSTPIFFCNPVDFAANIGKSEVFSAFGLNYVENFAGLGNLIATSKVPSGTIYCTASRNLKVYYIDANEAPDFDFEADESGYVAIKHGTTLNKLTYDTVAWTALTFFAEYVDFVVKGTIAPSE